MCFLRFITLRQTSILQLCLHPEIRIRRENCEVAVSCLKKCGDTHIKLRYLWFLKLNSCVLKHIHKFMELLGLNPQNPVFGTPRQNLGSAGLNPINPYIFGKLVEILGSSLYFRKGRARFGASGAKKHHFFGPPQ